MQKDDVVIPLSPKLLQPRYGSRPATQAEIDAWYASKTEPRDSAGESWIHSGNTFVAITPGMRLKVLRARCKARFGWSVVGGCCEVEDLASGEVFFVSREILQLETLPLT